MKLTQVQLICSKVYFVAFMCLQFVLAIFCRKEIGKNAANKMLVKFIPSDNFTNILDADFRCTNALNFYFINIVIQVYYANYYALCSTPELPS